MYIQYTVSVLQCFLSNCGFSLPIYMNACSVFYRENSTPYIECTSGSSISCHTPVTSTSVITHKRCSSVSSHRCAGCWISCACYLFPTLHSILCINCNRSFPHGIIFISLQCISVEGWNLLSFLWNSGLHCIIHIVILLTLVEVL